MHGVNGAAAPVTRVLFSCTGVGILDRGVETFFREAFDGLHGIEGIESMLLKGAGPVADGERVAWTLRRTGRVAPLVGRLTGRNGYVVEQWSSLASAAKAIRRFRPHVVFTSDANLGFLLHRFRRRIGTPFRLLFSNGGPCHPPFVRTDCVHQVAPHYLEEALAAGEPAGKHFLVPYGIGAPQAPPAFDAAARRAVRLRLGLPVDRPIVLSVGRISARHKRMDYTIREVASLAEPRPYLLLLGAMDSSSGEVLDLGRSLLGGHGFTAASVPYERVGDYYRAADCFALGSLREGFGRVYLESLMHGLPTIAHRHPVMEYVLGSVGTLADLSAPGGLARELPKALAGAGDAAAAHARWQSVRERFDWDVLRPRYREMFRACAAAAPNAAAHG
jgi:glycosyltransferase involved in cell wall biosynthesis